ncbi:hypothetical protein [Halalkalibacter alkalisediminis]|uniref:Uncharacterized protein n=1 Tax=Halalkalibacter alkalisediminis TaxID=935616 RepID=A0ABV6NCD2_9BACI|nr:hypothetical protein [Halalkalibacter alkalisediminis]
MGYLAVDSLSDGIVEKVCVHEGAFVYEWEPLFFIRTPNGAVKKVELGASGIVSKVHVTQGERVCIQMTLAVLEEDTSPTGCD